MDRDSNKEKKQLQVSTSVAGRTAKTQVIEYIESGELRKYDYYTNASWASWGSWWTRACKKKFLLKQFRTGFKS
jgi:inhibitor of KinA sporulation pathway (predicted exonuclease)